MIDNVFKFGQTILPGEPNPEMVETMERLLAQAKTGELRAISFATVRQGGVRGTGWEGSDGTADILGAATMMLHHRYAEYLMRNKD